MYVCITDSEGSVLVHKNLRTDTESFERTIAQLLRSGMLPQAYAYPASVQSAGVRKTDEVLARVSRQAVEGTEQQDW
jgi:hypothetical protein